MFRALLLSRVCSMTICFIVPAYSSLPRQGAMNGALDVAGGSCLKSPVSLSLSLSLSAPRCPWGVHPSLSPLSLHLSEYVRRGSRALPFRLCVFRCAARKKFSEFAYNVWNAESHVAERVRRASIWPPAVVDDGAELGHRGPTIDIQHGDLGGHCSVTKLKGLPIPHMRAQI